MNDPKDVVARGYDAAAQRYLEWSGLRPSPVRLEYLSVARDLIAPDSKVLELGCGAGVPMTAALAESREVLGVDISAAQIELARRNVPAATFLQSDMTALSFDDASFDAVVAFYSLTHVPRDEQPALLGRIRRWLRPGGTLIATMGVEDEPGDIEPGWLGVDMYFSHFSARKNRRLVGEAGFVIDRADVRAEPEDRHDARFLWVVAHAAALTISAVALALMLAACTTPSSPGASASPGSGTTPALHPSPIEPGYESPSPAT